MRIVETHVNPNSTDYKTFSYEASRLYADDAIQKSYGVKWYYRGGGELLYLSKDLDGDSFSYYIPPFSYVTPVEAINFITREAENIKKEIVETNSQALFFLIDTKTVKILTEDSFMEFCPYYNTKNAIYLLTRLNDKGEEVIETNIRYFTDKTTYAEIINLSFFIAKRELALPIASKAWSKTGKQLLCYMVSVLHKKPENFTSPDGMWNGVNYEFPEKRTPTFYMDEATLNCAKLDELADVSKAAASLMGDPAAEDKNVDDPDTTHSIRMSDITELGVSSFCKGEYGAIEVEMDILRDVYEAVMIDGKTGICLVKLQKGVKITKEQIKDELDADDVEILDSHAWLKDDIDDDDNPYGDYHHGGMYYG